MYLFKFSLSGCSKLNPLLLGVAGVVGLWPKAEYGTTRRNWLFGALRGLVLAGGLGGYRCLCFLSTQG